MFFKNTFIQQAIKNFNMKIEDGKIFNRLSMLAMVSLIFVAAMSAMTLPTVKASTGYYIYVDPPYQEVPVCTNFIVNVNLTAMTTLPGISFNLTFDPNLMECIGVTNTSFPLNPMEFVYAIDNTTGLVYVRITVSTGFDGSGTIADIEFHCKGEGTGFLNFSEVGPGTAPFLKYNGTCSQVPRPVGGEVLAIDALPLLIPWIAVAGAVAVATVLVLASRRTFSN
jgi:hypothetical protein